MKLSSEISIAVSKGRIFDEFIGLLKNIKVDLKNSNDLNSRKLILQTNIKKLSLVIVRATDVPTFVHNGAVDFGVVGMDTLVENDELDFYTPLDLKISKCRMILAANDKNKKILSSSIIATKYVKSAQQYLKKNGKQAQIIKLYGSMELAPILGMSDFIVDLVDTGQTLKENGLIEIENLFDVSSHMIVNKSSMKLKHDDVWCLINELENIIQAKK